MSEKYHIIESDYKDYPSECYSGSPYEDCILPIEMIDDFIIRVSSINLEEYYKKILEAKQNVKP